MLHPRTSSFLSVFARVKIPPHVPLRRLLSLFIEKHNISIILKYFLSHGRLNATLRISLMIADKTLAWVIVDF